jgi:BlaI family transcriptional regulator, penicillinase repressor
MKRPPLSPLELEVMNLVWDLGECSSATLVEQFTKRKPLAATTIRTVLANIEKKRYIERVPTTERGLRYRPRFPRETVAMQTLRQLVSRLFGGSSKLAIARLLDDEKLDRAELDELEKLIERRKKELRK